MKILYPYRDILRKGGQPHYARTIAAAVSEAGHDVAILGVDDPRRPDTVEPPPGVTVFQIPTGLAGRRAFSRSLDEFEPDLIHFAGGPRHLLHGPWSSQARRAGIPYVVSGAGNLSDMTYRYRWGGKRNSFVNYLMKKVYHRVFDRLLLHNAISVHAQSRNEAENALRFGARDTFVLPFGMLHEDVPDPETTSPRSLRQPMTFSYLGRLSIMHKGLDIIVEAFGKLAEAGFGDKFRLIIAGPSENGSLETLQQRASELGIQNIEFPGPVYDADKAEVWRETDFFLHLCRFTGFALTVREAMCAGIPVIATRVSDYGDWVDRFNLGRTVQPDVAALTEVLLGTLAMTDESYARLSRNAMEYVHATRWRALGRMYANEYARILTPGGGPQDEVLYPKEPAAQEVTSSPVAI